LRLHCLQCSRRYSNNRRAARVLRGSTPPRLARAKTLTAATCSLFNLSAPNLRAMSNDTLHTRIEELEARLMHQEAAIEELTHTLLKQEQLLTVQARAMERLESQLRSLADPQTLPSGEESPPPHY